MLQNRSKADFKNIFRSLCSANKRYHRGWVWNLMPIWSQVLTHPSIPKVSKVCSPIVPYYVIRLSEPNGTYFSWKTICRILVLENRFQFYSRSDCSKFIEVWIWENSNLLFTPGTEIPLRELRLPISGADKNKTRYRAVNTRLHPLRTPTGLFFKYIFAALKDKHFSN